MCQISIFPVSMYTGKNELMYRINDREVVFGMVIHTMLDAWHL